MSARPLPGFDRRLRAAFCAGVAAVLLAALLAPAGATKASDDGLQFGTFIFREPFEEGEFERLRAAGADAVRTTFQWAEVQHGLLPLYDWRKYDALMEQAAEERVSILPLLIGSPEFAAPLSSQPPTSFITKLMFAGFASAAVERYGHGGSFWDSHPELPYMPIEGWEVWNEPNLPSFWTAGQPDSREYAQLLVLIGRAIKLADPRAKVVLAGLAHPKTERVTSAPEFLAELYAFPVVREAFDVVAVHPYAATVQGVDRKLAQVRAVMARNGDAHKPLWITELGWSSAGAPHHLVKDPATQARLTGETVSLLRRRHDDYRLGTVIWFRWQDPEVPCPKPGGCWYDNAGLFTVDGEPKPAWSAFARGIGGDPGSGGLPDDD